MSDAQAEIIRAWPLQWPTGWKRTDPRQRISAKFSHKSNDGIPRGLTLFDAIERLLQQMRLMGVERDETVISTNVQTRLDGLPKSGAPQPLDPGVAVYWRRPGERPRCMAIDRYKSVADNIAAVALSLSALRAVERHGGAVIVDKAFEGFIALPSAESWWQVLGLDSPNASADDIEAAHRRLAMRHHPDRGGDTERMSAINRARDIGIEATR